MKIGKSVTLLMLIAFCVASMTGMGIIYYTQTAKDSFVLGEDVTLRPDGETTITQEVTELSLIPGTTKSYSVEMKCKAENTYDVKIFFTETGESPLRDYTFVEAYLDGASLGKVSLDDLLGGVTFETACKLYASSAAVLELRYTMPLEVGNEAERAAANFDVTISVVADSGLAAK